MRSFSLLAPALWLAVFTSVSLSAAEPTCQWPHEQSDLPPDPRAHFGCLENGLRYVILPNDEPQNRASLRLYISAGSLHENESQRGLAHFLEHMAFNGTEHFPADTLDKYLQRLGMSTGGDTNAYTTFDHTAYKIELPETAPSMLREGLTVLRDYAAGLLLQPEEIDKERGIILSERRTRDSVEYRTALAEYDLLFPESIIPERFPIGEAEVIAEAPRSEFTDFYDTWYRPDKMAVIVVGHIAPSEIEPLIRQTFGDLSARAPEREEPGLGRIPREPGVTARLHAEPEASRTSVSIQTVLPYEPEPDTAANRLKDLPRNVAFAILDRRLDILSKQEGAPFLVGSAGVFEGFDFFTNAFVELTCQPAQWEESLRLAEQELRRALEHGFQPAEVKEVVANLINAYDLAVKTAPTRRSERLAQEVINSLNNEMVFTHPETERTLMVPALEGLTPEACLEAFRELWDHPNRYLFVSGNLDLSEPENAIFSVYRQSGEVAVEAPAQITDEAFAYTGFGPAGAISSREHVPDLDVVLVEYENGVRLNLKKTDYEANTIRLLVRFGGGRLTQPLDKPGLGLMANLVFTQGGLGKHSLDDLQRILAGKTVGVSFSVRDDAFVLAGNTSPEDLLLELQLIAAYLTDPGYREEAIRLARKALEQQYTRFRHTPDGVLQTEVPRLLASGDPRFGLPPEEVAQARTLEEVRSWLAPALAEGSIEIGIVGDIEIDATLEAVGRTLGALPPRGPKPDLTEERQVHFPPNPFSKSYEVETEIQKGVVALFWPTTDQWDIRRTRRLSILAEIFSDRMRDKIREEIGGAYSPFAASAPSEAFKDYGFLVSQITVDPGQAEEIAQAVRELAQAIHRQGISPDELERAIKPRLTAIREAIRTNSYWLGSVLASAQEFPQRLDWARTILEDHQAISTAEIEMLARLYLDPTEAFQVIVLPEE